MSAPCLLFVNMHYLPDVASTGQHLGDLTEYLAHTGYDVAVYCGRGHYVEGRVDAPARETLNGVRVCRLRTTTFGRQTHLVRLLNYILFYWQVFARVLTRERRSHVIFLTTPPLLAFIGYLASRLRATRYGIWSMDLHPDAETAAGLMRESGAIYRLLHTLNALGYRHADFIVDLGPFMKRRIAAYGVPKKRLYTVNIWSSCDDIEPVTRKENPLAEGLDLGERTVVMYSGNAGIAHQFNEVLKAIYGLRHDERFRFLFIGAGPRRAGIEGFVAEMGISNFRYLDYFPREKLSQSLALGDIHLVTLRQEFAGIAVPGKLSGIMAAGRPVLFVGPTECETAAAIRVARCGEVIDPYRHPSPVARIVETLQQWTDNPELCHEMGMRGRQAALRTYERGLCCAAFEDVIRQHWGSVGNS